MKELKKENSAERILRKQIEQFMKNQYHSAEFLNWNVSYDEKGFTLVINNTNKAKQKTTKKEIDQPDFLNEYIYKGGYCAIRVPKPKKKGFVEAFIDIDDAVKCTEHKWKISKQGRIYTLIDSRMVYLHRFVLDLKISNNVVFQKNNIFSDCRRSNLRTDTRNEHMKRVAKKYKSSLKKLKEKINELSSQLEDTIYN